MALLEDANFVLDRGLAELVDPHACINHTWVRNGAEEVAVRGHDYAVFLGLRMKGAAAAVFD